MLSRSLAVTLGLALLVACSPGDVVPAPIEEATSAAPSTTSESGGAIGETFDVQVDGIARDFTSFYLAYFPRDIQVHPGDTVEFTLVDTGEPHTVTFGQIVDEAMAVIAEKGEAAIDDPAIERIPPMLPEGPGDAIQSAAQPCFLSDTDPGTDACRPEERVQPNFDGTQTYYNSGWMTSSESFSVTIDPQTEPGTYSYICILHYPDMSGTVTVVDADTEIAPPEDVYEAGNEELAAMEAALAPAVEAAIDNTPELTSTNTVISGIAVPEVPNAMASIFVPEELEIAAGETVTWNILGPHVIAFNAPEEALTLRLEDEEGVHINPLLVGPSGGPGQPPPPGDDEQPADAASDEASEEGDSGSDDADADTSPGSEGAGSLPEPINIDAGEWDGDGFLSSGLILSFPPSLFSYSVTFTEPGTYLYKCTLHPGMAGTVIVQ